MHHQIYFQLSSFHGDILLQCGKPLNGLELDTVLVVENNPIVQLKRPFHLGGMAESIPSIEVDEGELDLLYGKSLPNAGSGSNPEWDVSIGVSPLLFLTPWIKPLWLELVWLWELLGILGQYSQS